MATSKLEKNPFQAVVDEVDSEKEEPKTSQKSTASQTVAAAKEMLNRDKAQRTLAQIYSSQTKIPVRVAPSYAKYFGKIMRVTINGIAVAVPCDGRSYDIPEEFAFECERRMREMDGYELKSRKLADITNNYEPDIGHLSFF